MRDHYYRDNAATMGGEAQSKKVSG